MKATDKVLDSKKAYENGADLCQWSYHGIGVHQRFQLQPYGDGSYAIHVHNSHFVLDAAAGGRLVMWEKHGLPHQRWRIILC